MRADATAEAVAALRDGRAFADLSAWPKALVRGSDAATWLGDLVTAELAGMAPGRSRPSLLLGPTGRIRAAFTVAATPHGHLVVQGPGQPLPVGDLLAPYVLSSDVRIEDVTSSVALVAFPGGRPADGYGEFAFEPSCLGPGTDVGGPDREELRRAAAGAVEAGPDALEAWRIQEGVARFGVDLGPDSLPHEADFGTTIAYDKGCFLGQESVARVRNLGHPPFVILAVRATGPVTAGEAVRAGPDDAGVVTSSAPGRDGGTAAIVRVRWAARREALRTDGGTALETVGPASGTP
jgi:folate-binding protein YgfZ